MPAGVTYVISTGDWQVDQVGYDGAWAAFSDKQVAINFCDWLNANFDTDGIIARLYGEGNTPEDLEQIRYIIQRSKHVTAVPDIYDETLSAKFNRERGVPKWE